MIEVKPKDLVVKPISRKDADRLCKLFHYSGKVAATSQIHFGVFFGDNCYGIMQFGAPIDKKRTMTLVKETRWNGFLELNRMAFSDFLPKNSESRCLAIAIKIIKKNYPFIEWILSYSDATQSGDGTIYRACGFNLVGIKKNKAMVKTKNGEVICSLILTIHSTSEKEKLRHGFIPGKDTLATWMKRENATYIPGYQLKYFLPLTEKAKINLTVKPLPYSTIDHFDARMHRGIKRSKHKINASDFQSEEGGATPTATLQINGEEKCH